MLTRRQLLAAALASPLALPALGALFPAGGSLSTQGGLRFIYVLAPGGWDTTRVFMPQFGQDLVDMEADATSAQIGGISFVDHPDRPSVRAFFQAWGARSLVLNGMLVPSVAHRACMRLLLTGSIADGQPDWPALVAAASTDWTIPHLVLDGPAFPGPYGGSVVRTGSGGQLAGLLDGSIVDRVTPSAGRLSPELLALVDQRARDRASAALERATTTRDQGLAAAHADALGRALALTSVAPDLPWDTGGTFDGQVDLAVAALARGLCRSCGLTFATERDWDSHYLNDERQSPLYESLFAGLDRLVGLLDTTLDPDGAPLSQRTLIVVLSEMGRTPLLNGSKGKDHWPYTSALLVGTGVTGDRVVGGLDEGSAGLYMDPSTGELDAKGIEVSTVHLGATLLTLAGVDPSELLSDIDPLLGLLS